jgi:hypothetical protein
MRTFSSASSVGQPALAELWQERVRHLDVVTAGDHARQQATAAGEAAGRQIPHGPKPEPVALPVAAWPVQDLVRLSIVAHTAERRHYARIGVHAAEVVAVVLPHAPQQAGGARLGVYCRRTMSGDGH